MKEHCDCGAKVDDQHLPACYFSGIVTGNETYGEKIFTSERKRTGLWLSLLMTWDVLWRRK